MIPSSANISRKVQREIEIERENLVWRNSPRFPLALNQRFPTFFFSCVPISSPFPSIVPLILGKHLQLILLLLTATQTCLFCQYSILFFFLNAPKAPGKYIYPRLGPIAQEECLPKRNSNVQLRDLPSIKPTFSCINNNTVIINFLYGCSSL